MENKNNLISTYPSIKFLLMIGIPLWIGITGTGIYLMTKAIMDIRDVLVSLPN